MNLRARARGTLPSQHHHLKKAAIPVAAAAAAASAAASPSLGNNPSNNDYKAAIAVAISLALQVANMQQR
jgi:hypothetical protein